MNIKTVNLEERFRNKVTLIHFLLSVGIVYQHTVWHYNENPVLNAGQLFLFYLTETCVPFFFMISGYLFFRTYQPSVWKRKLLSRVKTLLVPYVLWNLIYAVFMGALIYIGLITSIAFPNSVGKLILQIINADFSTLWFVKYLMFFTLIDPIMYYLLRHRVLGIVAILIMVLLNIWCYYSEIMQIPLDVNANNLVMLNYQYIFYAIGAYGALNLKNETEKPSKQKNLAGIAVLVVLIILYFRYLVSFGNVITNHAFRIVYVVALWFALDFIPEFEVYDWMKDSFFLYCSHWMVLLCAERVCSILIERSGIIKSVFFVAEYCFLPIFVILGLIIIAETMKRKQPKVYGILTGNR